MPETTAEQLQNKTEEIIEKIKTVDGPGKFQVSSET
jgi:hypothetical protein